MDWLNFHELLCDAAGIRPFGNERNALLPDHIATRFAALPLTLGRHPDKHPEFLQPLATLLVNHCRSKCKDAKDRVFSLLGLVNSDERRLLSRFFPDYTMHVDVVRIVTLAHLMQYGRLEDPELRNITPNSDDIFRGLGLTSRSVEQRRRLIDQAKEFDYLDSWEPGQFSSVLESGMLHFPIGTEDAVEDESLEECPGIGTMWAGEVGMQEMLTPWGNGVWPESTWAEESNSEGKCCSKMLKMLFVLLILGAVGYFLAIGKSFRST